MIILHCGYIDSLEYIYSTGNLIIWYNYLNNINFLNLYTL